MSNTTILKANHYIYGMIHTEFKEFMPGDTFEAPQHLVDLWTKDCKWATIINGFDPVKSGNHKFKLNQVIKERQGRRNRSYQVVELTSDGYYMVPWKEVGRLCTVDDWHNVEWVHEHYEKA
jgi:hypothetical protein